MKNPLSLLVLVLGLGLQAVGSSDASAQTVAPAAITVVADTGVVTLGPNQLLRLTAVNGGGGQGSVLVRFREIGYGAGTCNGPVCIHAVAAQNTYGLLTLTAGAAASLEIANTNHGERVVVSSDSPSLQVLAEIVDGTSNTIMAFLKVPDIPGPSE